MNTVTITLGHTSNTMNVSGYAMKHVRTFIMINGKNAAYVNEYGQIFRTNSRADKNIAAIEAFVADQIANGNLTVKPTKSITA